jgi:hypothetical protein
MASANRVTPLHRSKQFGVQVAIAKIVSWVVLSSEAGMNKKTNFSGLLLVTSCTTLSLIAGLSLAVIFTCATAAFAGADSAEAGNAVEIAREAGSDTPGSRTLSEIDFPPDKTFSGVVTDDHCGARHAMDSNMSSAECARMCVRNGSPYELIDGDRKYALDGNIDALNQVAGQRARISGTLEGSIIRVISVESDPRQEISRTLRRPD